MPAHRLARRVGRVGGNGVGYRAVFLDLSGNLERFSVEAMHESRAGMTEAV